MNSSVQANLALNQSLTTAKSVIHRQEANVKSALQEAAAVRLGSGWPLSLAVQNTTSALFKVLDTSQPYPKRVNGFDFSLYGPTIPDDCVLTTPIVRG